MFIHIKISIILNFNISCNYEKTNIIVQTLHKFTSIVLFVFIKKTRNKYFLSKLSENRQANFLFVRKTIIRNILLFTEFYVFISLFSNVFFSRSIKKLNRYWTFSCITIAFFFVSSYTNTIFS